MNSLTPSQWVSHFAALQDIETIRQRATVTVPAVSIPTSMKLELAYACIEQALNTIFYPTSQCLSVLERLAGMALAHCSSMYPDRKAFLSGVYSREPPLDEFMAPICLTGLAGTGKTEILKAFGRLHESDDVVVLDKDHPLFEIRGSQLVTVKARSSPKDLLRCLAQGDGSPAELISSARKLLFRDGVSLLLMDEFQFATGSENANARVAQMLLSIGYLGIPFVYAANFSLISRLQRRPGEEQHRLLSNPIVLTPDCATSSDWQNTLAAQCGIAPEIFVFDPVVEAEALHAYCGGRKRAMAKLLLLAFREQYHRGRLVDLGAIHRAYLSAEYAVYRQETEILATQGIQSRAHPKRKDLWCPIPLTGSAATAFLRTGVAAREALVADVELAASLTREEKRKARKDRQEISRGTPMQGQVVPLPHKSKATADDLKRNAGLFRDHLKPLQP